MRLEELSKDAVVEGVEYGGAVTVVDVDWAGDDVVLLTYRASDGQVDEIALFRENESRLEIVSGSDGWTFEGDGDIFRLVMEAYRLKMAYLFDPHLAVHASHVDPLPHQISAVYEKMLTKQPLRFLLADDPGAGKTIMAGLLMKELYARGALERCLVCCPGSLAEQWQDELRQKFDMRFEMVSGKKDMEASAISNPFAEKDFVIGRLDHMSRDEVREKVEQTEWDLVVVDEAHKMSARFSGGEINPTKRYRLGEMLSSASRNFLLMTATPHNGKEEEFQLFLKLLDADRFEGRFKKKVHKTNTNDLMRRTIKEELRNFDGSRLFPDRRASTVTYELSALESQLYEEVTKYVQNEFNKADALQKGRARTVGFALTILQRRLASSPEAIYRSLVRRRERLTKKLEEARRHAAREIKHENRLSSVASSLYDTDDLPVEELEEVEEEVLDLATAARTIAELEFEIFRLDGLERLAERVRESKTDRKWQQLSQLLQEREEMRDEHGNRRKLIVFTEHKDTLYYLANKMRGMLGDPASVVTISGGMRREVRRTTQERFLNDANVIALVATDAAGEGVNLQRANLMVNYDLPWNPNRLEQRFGRIHRIGQQNTCYLWNLVAADTREGDVFNTLLGKLDRESKALKGKVFDVLGEVFKETPLRELLTRAIREGQHGRAPKNVKREIDEILDHNRLVKIVEQQGLASEVLGLEKVAKIKDKMEREDARRLQPHFVASFFLEAYRRLGGRFKDKGPARYELPSVPPIIMKRAKQYPGGTALAESYRSVTFDKREKNAMGKEPATFLHPGHALLDATVDLTLERNKEAISTGAILVDEAEEETRVRVLVCLEHEILDARKDKNNKNHVVSRRLQFVELFEDGEVREAGYAPYLDYRPLHEGEKEAAHALNTLEGQIENRAKKYAVVNLAREHLEHVRKRVEDRVKRTEKAVWERLTQEITYVDSEIAAYQRRLDRLRGEPMSSRIIGGIQLNLDNARRRKGDVEWRRNERMQELQRERDLKAGAPVVVNAALVVPASLLAHATPNGGAGSASDGEAQTHAKNTRVVEAIAMHAVMECEEALGHYPKDVASKKLGYDVESRDGENGTLRVIEVKGRAAGSTSVTVTRNEIITALNKPDDFVLAVVEVEGDAAREPRYVRKPFDREPDFRSISVNYDLKKLLETATEPS